MPDRTKLINECIELRQQLKKAEDNKQHLLVWELRQTLSWLERTFPTECEEAKGRVNPTMPKQP